MFDDVRRERDETHYDESQGEAGTRAEGYRDKLLMEIVGGHIAPAKRQRLEEDELTQEVMIDLREMEAQ